QVVIAEEHQHVGPEARQRACDGEVVRLPKTKLLDGLTKRQNLRVVALAQINIPSDQRAKAGIQIVHAPPITTEEYFERDPIPLGDLTPQRPEILNWMTVDNRNPHGARR